MATKTKKTTKKTASKKPKKAAHKTKTQQAIDKTVKRSGKRNVYRAPTTKFLVKEMFKVLKRWWRPILSITAIYGAFYFVLVQGITAINVGELNTFIEENFGADINNFGTTLILTGAIFGLNSELDQVTGVITSILFIVNSLAMIWVLRHIWLKRHVSVKESYYQGMYPLIPFVIILVIMLIQIIPFSFGGYITSVIFANEIAVSVFERGLVILFFLFTALVSGYLLTGSALSLYLVTIPDMTPMKALRTAKEVLKRRRLLVMQRILVFILTSLLIAFGLLLLSVSIWPPIAPVFVSLLAIVALPWIHTFMYVLYRHLIED